MTAEDMKHQEHIKPNDCTECSNFGISKLTKFPSLCKRNYAWFECGGKFGYKIPIEEDTE